MRCGAAWWREARPLTERPLKSCGLWILEIVLLCQGAGCCLDLHLAIELLLDACDEAVACYWLYVPPGNRESVIADEQPTVVVFHVHVLAYVFLCQRRDLFLFWTLVPRRDGVIVVAVGGETDHRS